MLGSEYNWLLSLERSARGSWQIRLRNGGLLTVFVAVFCTVTLGLMGNTHAKPHADRVTSAHNERPPRSSADIPATPEAHPISAPSDASAATVPTLSV